MMMDKIQTRVWFDTVHDKHLIQLTYKTSIYTPTWHDIICYVYIMHIYII